MNKIKIVQVVPPLISSGPINVVENILRNIDRSKFEPIIVSLSKINSPRECTDRFKEMGIKIFQFNYSKRELLFNQKKIAQTIENTISDSNAIYHMHCYFPTVIGKYLHNTKRIATIHNIAQIDYKAIYGNVIGTYMCRCFKRALQEYAKLVVLCNSMKDSYINWGLKKLETIYNGVQSKNYLERVDPQNVKLKRFIYPASFRKSKNHEFIINAIKNSNVSNIEVIFAGDGANFEKCINICNNDYRIKFLGRITDINTLINECDVIVSSSITEGLPLGVLEGVIAGMPCFLSDIPPHREIVEKLGLDKNKWLFDLNNPHDFISKIEEIKLLDINKLQIRNKALDIFSDKVMASNYQMLYSSFKSRKDLYL